MYLVVWYRSLSRFLRKNQYTCHLSWVFFLLNLWSYLHGVEWLLCFAFLFRWKTRKQTMQFKHNPGAHTFPPFLQETSSVQIYFRRVLSYTNERHSMYFCWTSLVLTDVYRKRKLREKAVFFYKPMYTAFRTGHNQHEYFLWYSRVQSEFWNDRLWYHHVSHFSQILFQKYY